MKHLLKSAAVLACVAAAGSSFVPLSTGQTTPAQAKPAAVAAPAASQPKYTEAELLQLIKEVSTQQQQLKLNQETAENKLAVIQEDVRQARIFAARSGKKP